MTTRISPRRVAVLLLLVSLALPTAAWAKGQTTRVVLSCMGFARPMEITDAAALSLENGPWGGRFLDSTKKAVPAAPARRVCQVDFYVRYSERDERLAYVMYYYPGSKGEAGYIHLPGRGEPWYDLNAGSILRPGIDGSWRVASARWEQSVVRPALATGCDARCSAMFPAR